MTFLTRKIPIMEGNLLEVAGILASMYLVLLASEIPMTALSFLLYLVALCGLLFFPHCLTHYIVGRLLGIRFRYYSVNRSAVSKLRLGPLASIASGFVVLRLNIDRESLRSVTPLRRNAMFMSGAIASMIFPFFPALASLGHLPIFLSILLLLISIGNFAFDLYFSPRAGDFSRVKSHPPSQ